VRTVTADVVSENRYSVEVRADATGQRTQWSVAIVDPDGREVAVRACRDEGEAGTYASTVRQHIVWLSEARFGEIYRLADGA